MLKSNGKRAVSIDLEGALLDFTTRRMVTPPPDLSQVFGFVPHMPDFKVLRDSLRPA